MFNQFIFFTIFIFHHQMNDSPINKADVNAGAITPPPLRVQRTDAEPDTPSPTLDALLAPLSLNDEERQQVSQAVEGIATDALSPSLLTLLTRGVRHDEDVRNADAAGYLRGRNDKIESVLPRRDERADEDEAEHRPVFPHYCRRSVWD